MMSSKADNTVYVVRAAGGDVEVLTSIIDACEYVRCKRGATVLELAVRRSIGEASVVYERRLHIVGGDVRADTTGEELFFAVGDESGIPSADVESFEGKNEQWTVVGLGTDRSRVDELVAEEFMRLRGSAVQRRADAGHDGRVLDATPVVSHETQAAR